MILVNTQGRQTDDLALRIIQMWTDHEVAVAPGATHREVLHVAHHVGAARDLVRRTMIAILAPVVVRHHLGPVEDHVRHQVQALAMAILVTLALSLDLNPTEDHVHHQVLALAPIPATMILATICTLLTRKVYLLQAPMTEGHVAAAGVKAVADEMTLTT